MDNDKMPAGLGCNEGLGPLPERDLVERLRSRVPPEARHGTTCAEDDMLEAADEIERLRAVAHNADAVLTHLLDKGLPRERYALAHKVREQVREVLGPNEPDKRPACRSA